MLGGACSAHASDELRGLKAGEKLPEFELATVKGGTGWGAEFAKLCNKPLYVFDQDKGDWFRWSGDAWETDSEPTITHHKFTGTGTRFINESGKAAIDALFGRSFG